MESHTTGSETMAYGALTKSLATAVDNFKEDTWRAVGI
jgi:hypothetical protein